VNVANVRQSRPDFGLVFQAKVLETFQVVHFLLGIVYVLSVLGLGLRVWG
jgi:hypothetical protein